MKNFKNLFLATLAVGSLALSGCLHIVEEVTFKGNGSGNYKMTLDMSEIKGMMDMLKGMNNDSLSADSAKAENPMGAMGAGDNGTSEMGQQLSSVAQTLKGVEGLSHITEINDTSNLNFGYSFDFVDVAALNKAMKIIGKEKYDSKVDEVFKYNGKNFERLASGDLGQEIKKALSEGGDADGEGNMDMIKTFFADMTYKQVYHFPDRAVKKSSNELSELTDGGHTLTISLKPFDEEEQKKKLNVGTVVKLK